MMREKLLRLMAGRNGNDELNRFLLYADVAVLLLAMIFSRSLGRLLMPLALIVLGITYFRMFSRNLPKRRAENERYLAKRYKVVHALRVEVQKWKQRKEYKFFSCPACK